MKLEPDPLVIFIRFIKRKYIIKIQQKNSKRKISLIFSLLSLDMKNSKTASSSYNAFVEPEPTAFAFTRGFPL